MNIEMKTKTVYKKCTFPSDIDTIFRLLTDLKTLQYIAFPYAKFVPVDTDQNGRKEKLSHSGSKCSTSFPTEHIPFM